MLISSGPRIENFLDLNEVSSRMEDGDVTRQ